MVKTERQLLEEKYAGVPTLEFETDLKRLAAGEPLAYVIGSQPFLGLRIYLDSHPLIPRPETEWWIEELLKEVKSPATFLDLCAGSGAIGCAALKFLPQAEVYFGELDPAHEETIRKNIRENGLDASRADIRIGNLFRPFGDMKFDVIAANPPYIPSSRSLPDEVSKYEPKQALFSGPDGLDVIRRIATELPDRLARGGAAWIECDREHSQAARKLFVDQGFIAGIRTDQYGEPRIIVVSFPINAEPDAAAVLPADRSV